jgi:CDP-glycerol glycerophosphotransferase (TagB/SpsB family)
MSRAEFCRMLGLNPSKKIIFFNPWGNMFTLNGDGDRYVMEILKEIDANIIVRFNPTLEVRLDGFEPSANMVLDKPGVVFKEDSYGDRDISEEDDLRLINELYHSDVVITSASTIAVDAAIFDKPLIGVALSRVPVSWWEGVEKFYHQEHFYNVMKTGGIRLCRTKEELLNLIGLYLKNPSRDAAGRKKIVEEQCWKLDGKASVRVSEFLLNYA